jgi:fermentation-respiration switch protein FrsA (DUF1100 family)
MPGLRRFLSVLLVFVALASCSSGGSAVRFRSEDGIPLEGRLFGTGTKAVILAHMYPSDERSWFPFAKELSLKGYEVLAFDFRGYGGSSGNKDIDLINRDVIGAIEFVRKRGAQKVVLVGASMGGTASLVAAAEQSVDGVATLSAPLAFKGLDASKVIGAISATKLFLVSKDDPNSDDAENMLRGSHDPTADIRIFPGSDHGTNMLSGSKGEEVKKMLFDFIDKAVS